MPSMRQNHPTPRHEHPPAPPRPRATLPTRTTHMPQPKLRPHTIKHRQQISRSLQNLLRTSIRRHARSRRQGPAPPHRTQISLANDDRVRKTLVPERVLQEREAEGTLRPCTRNEHARDHESNPSPRRCIERQAGRNQHGPILLLHR